MSRRRPGGGPPHAEERRPTARSRNIPRPTGSGGETGDPNPALGPTDAPVSGNRRHRGAHSGSDVAASGLGPDIERVVSRLSLSAGAIAIATGPGHSSNAWRNSAGPSLTHFDSHAGVPIVEPPWSPPSVQSNYAHGSLRDGVAVLHRPGRCVLGVGQPADAKGALAPSAGRTNIAARTDAGAARRVDHTRATVICRARPHPGERPAERVLRVLLLDTTRSSPLRRSQSRPCCRRPPSELCTWSPVPYAHGCTSCCIALHDQEVRYQAARCEAPGYDP